MSRNRITLEEIKADVIVLYGPILIIAILSSIGRQREARKTKREHERRRRAAGVCGWSYRPVERGDQWSYHVSSDSPDRIAWQLESRGWIPDDSSVPVGTTVWSTNRVLLDQVTLVVAPREVYRGSIWILGAQFEALVGRNLPRGEITVKGSHREFARTGVMPSLNLDPEAVKYREATLGRFESMYDRGRDVPALMPALQKEFVILTTDEALARRLLDSEVEEAILRFRKVHRWYSAADLMFWLGCPDFKIQLRTYLDDPSMGGPLVELGLMLTGKVLAGES